MTTTFHFEPKQQQQYGGATWVEVLVDGVLVARVDWVNGPPYLAARTVEGMDRERQMIQQCQEHNEEVSRQATRRIAERDRGRS